jgi:hypothetical protein
VTVLTEQEIDWISAVAGRLRLVQADAEPASPEKKRDYLMEETARALKTVPPAQRKRYLEALLSRFPVAGQVTKPVPVPAAAPATPKPTAESPDQLLTRFLGAVAELPPGKRAEYSKRLADAGLLPALPEAPVLEVPPEVWKALGLAADQQPRLDRLAQLSVILVDMVHRLNDRAVEAMHDLFPRSQQFDRPTDFRQAASRFLTGETESLDSKVRAVSSLLGTLLVALEGGCRDFGRQYLERYSPSAILQVVENEQQFGLLPWQQSKQECCWRKYNDLAKELSSPDLVDRKIKESLAAFVKRKGLSGESLS